MNSLGGAAIDDPGSDYTTEPLPSLLIITYCWNQSGIGGTAALGHPLPYIPLWILSSGHHILYIGLANERALPIWFIN